MFVCVFVFCFPFGFMWVPIQEAHLDLKRRGPQVGSHCLSPLVGPI